MRLWHIPPVQARTSTGRLPTYTLVLAGVDACTLAAWASHTASSCGAPRASVAAAVNSPAETRPALRSTCAARGKFLQRPAAYMPACMSPHSPNTVQLPLQLQGKLTAWSMLACSLSVRHAHTWPLRILMQRLSRRGAWQAAARARAGGGAGAAGAAPASGRPSCSAGGSGRGRRRA
jgi:hypothetical protein